MPLAKTEMSAASGRADRRLRSCLSL